MTDAEALEAIDKLHGVEMIPVYGPEDLSAICRTCMTTWPCETAKIILDIPERGTHE